MDGRRPSLLPRIVRTKDVELGYKTNEKFGTEEVQLQYAIYYLASFVPLAPLTAGIPYSHDPRQKADLKEHYHLARIIYHN